MKKLSGYQRFSALFSAAAMSCYALLGTGSPLHLAAQTEDPLVSVIVTLTGDAVLASDAAAQQGAAFVETDEAQRMQARLDSVQTIAEEELRALYPALTVGYHYHLVQNGFSCKLPESLLGQAQALPLVEQILPVQTYHAPKPCMYDAPELSHASAFRQQTGCDGEGEVICVIDTELDITHPMFAAMDDKANRLASADIERLCKRLTVSADPTQAYRSSKLPFVFDYTDDSPYDVADPDHYHGTHVCGIAAGNRVTDENGQEISGMASDAQIVFMKIFRDYEETDSYTTEGDIIAAALEDAVTLGADVINLSLGSPTQTIEDLAYAQAIEAAEHAGILICAAAGNEADHSTEDYTANPPSRIDYGTVEEPSIFPTVLSVASADNAYKSVNAFRIAETGTAVEYVDCSALMSFGQYAGQTLRYEYCGYGLAEHYKGKSMEGKFALLDSGSISFEEQQLHAQNAGAAGIILISQTEETRWIDNEYDGVVLSIPHAAGEEMKAVSDKKISLSETVSERILAVPTVSEFSSRGVAENLDLKPDIMGVGGNVISAQPGGGYAELFGTSMATPYLSGAAAVLDAALRQQGSIPAGEARSAFLRALLMNTARLYTDEEALYISPRAQGAGMVDLENAMQGKVLLTGAQGSAKIALYDKLGDTLSFDVNLHNFSGEDVTFSSARLVLTTDDTVQRDYDNAVVISGQQALQATADVSALLHSAAGESRTEHITVQLDAAQLQEIGNTFRNGFFIEGYLLLEGAANCCDISIPLLGFHGDWAAVPIFEETGGALRNHLVVPAGLSNINGEVSLGKLLCAADTVIAPLRTELQDARSNAEYFNRLFTAFDRDDTAYDALEKADVRHYGVFISPNEDRLADEFALKMGLLREAEINGMMILDMNNQLLTYGDSVFWNEREASNWYPWVDLSELPEGDYTAKFTGAVHYADAQAHPQEYCFPFRVDTTAPEVTSTVTEENGRRYLDLQIRDTSLDAVYVLGMGKGSSDSGHTMTGRDLCALMRLSRGRIETYDSLAFDAVPAYMPTIVKLFSKDVYEPEVASLCDYDYADIFTPVVETDGTASVRLDITELTDYTIDIVDKAYNATEIREHEPLFTGFQAGVWHRSGVNARYYLFEDETGGTMIDQQTGKAEPFTFAVEGVGAKFTYPDSGTSEIFDLTNQTPKRVLMQPQSPDAEGEDVMYYVGTVPADGFRFYSNEQLSELAELYTAQTYDIAVTEIRTEADAEGTVSITVYFQDPDTGDSYPFQVYQVDPFTASGTDDSNLPVSLVEEPDAAPLPGDVNGDGDINAADSSEILIAAAKVGAGEPHGLKTQQYANADVNQDDAVNAADASVILQYAAAVGAGVEGAKLTDFV